MDMTLWNVRAASSDFVKTHVFASIKLHRAAVGSAGVFTFDITVTSCAGSYDVNKPVRINNVVYHVWAIDGTKLLVPPAAIGTATATRPSPNPMMPAPPPLAPSTEVSEYFLRPAGQLAVLDTSKGGSPPSGLRAKPRELSGRSTIKVEIYGDVDKAALLAHLFPAEQSSRTMYSALKTAA